MSNAGIITERGDVRATGTMTDNALIRGDGEKRIQDSGILCDDSDNLTNINTIAVIDGATTRANLGLTIGTDVQAWDTDLDGLAALGDTGIVARTASGSFSARTISAGSEYVTISDGDGVSGNPTFDLSTNSAASAIHGWNGSIVESPVVTVTSDGATITCSIEKSGGGSLTAIFSDGYYAWDTTPAATIALTAGTDTSPQINYVYLLQSNKTLTISTSAFPSAEHAPLATVLCQSAASLQTDGAYKVHAWTDHTTTSNDQGHIGDLNHWIRHQQASYSSGVTQTYTITPNGGAVDNVILTTAVGVILQLHDHNFPAFTGSPTLYVVNDNLTPYTKVTDLSSLLTDSTGASMSGKYFSLVVWGVVSETTGDCKLYCNLPGGSYNTSAGVTQDANRFADYSIPSDLVGVGFLISEWKLRHQVAASGTWTSVDEVDLRGLEPSIVPGGGNAFPTEFLDNTFRINDDVDPSKQIAFQASSITAATTRTITVPDESGTLVFSTVDADEGGTGRASHTAYAVICGGTTTTAAQQSIASVGTADQVLTSNGAGALPTFKAGGGGNFVQPGILNDANYGYPGFPVGSSTSSISVSNKRLYITPLLASESFTIAKIHCEVSSAVAGATGRMGIYEFVDTGAFTIVNDPGTFSAATTGIKSLTVNEAIDPSKRYYLAVTIDENGGAVSLRSLSATLSFAVDLSGANMTGISYFTQNTVDPASSLPSPLSSLNNNLGNAPIMVISKA